MNPGRGWGVEQVEAVSYLCSPWLVLLRKHQMWYIYTMDYYSAIKNNEIFPFVRIWMDLEGTIVTEISRTKDKYHMISPICRI